MPRTGFEVAVEYKGKRYRLAGKAPDKAAAEKEKDVLVLMLQQLGVFSQGGRVPSMQHPQQTYFVPGLPVVVVNVPTELRSRLIAAMQVPANVFNAHAFVQCTEVRVVTSTYDIPYTRVTASRPVRKGWRTVGQWQVNPHMWDIIKEPFGLCMQKHDTLFTACALAVPRTFEGALWDAKQHAEQHAQPGLLLDYEYVPYHQYLRRIVVLHVCERWVDFAPFVMAEHGPGIATAADYSKLMLHKYSNTGLLTEVLALCDIYQSSVVVVDVDSSKVYEVFPRQIGAGANSRITLLHNEGFWHVLLPGRATDVSLPAFMSVPPAAWYATEHRMVYTRTWSDIVGPGLVGCMDPADALPPVCLAMPPRSAQGASLAAAPPPWEGEPRLGLFSFTCPVERPLPGGCLYYGWRCGSGTDICYFVSESDTGSDENSSSGSISSNGTTSDGDGDGDGASCLHNTPLLAIPCQGGEAVARFLVAGFYSSAKCWQCGGAFAGLNWGRTDGSTCTCTSCRCKACAAGAPSSPVRFANSCPPQTLPEFA